MHKVKRKSLFLLFVLTVLLLSACNKGEENVPIDQEIEREEDEVAEETSLPYTYPLTGIETEEQLDRRVVGVTINNHPAARPQSGIADADIVYEVLAEGEMTRFVALFHSTLPERVGPVRSARPYLIDLVKGYNGLFVTHGWSPEAEKMLKNGYADYLNGLFHDGTLFKRSSDRKAPHNSYITFDNIFAGLESKGYELNGPVPSLAFYKEDEEREIGDEGRSIEINYLNRNYVQYEYDETSGYYERYNGDQKTVDYETNEPVYISNVFIIEAEHRIVDDVGRREIDLDSGGNALLFQNGSVQSLEWENRDGIIVPVQNGEVVLLKPGKTWINIVPSSPGIESSVTY